MIPGSRSAAALGMGVQLSWPRERMSPEKLGQSDSSNFLKRPVSPYETGTRRRPVTVHTGFPLFEIAPSLGKFYLHGQDFSALLCINMKSSASGNHCDEWLIALGITLVLASGCPAVPGDLAPGITPLEMRAAADVGAMSQQADGKTLLAGNFWWVDGVPAPGLTRLTASGFKDPDFVPAVGVGLPHPLNRDPGGLYPPRLSLLSLSDGRTWVEMVLNAGNPSVVLGMEGQLAPGQLAGVGNVHGARIHAEASTPGKLVLSVVTRSSVDGAVVSGEIRGVDLTDGRTLWSHASLAGATALPERAWPSGDGWWVAGSFKVAGGGRRVWRIHADGSLDQSVSPLDFGGGSEYAFAPLAAGRLAILARILTTFDYPKSDIERVLVTTLNPAGSTHSSFSKYQNVEWLPRATGAADGSLLTNLNTDNKPPHFQRMALDGAMDASFTPLRVSDGTAIAVWPNGKIQAGASRHLPDGTLDPAWHRPSVLRPATTRLLAPAPDDGVYATGYFFSVGGQPHAGTVRLDRDGSLHPGFQLDPQITGRIINISSLPDGRLYLLEEPLLPPLLRVIRVMPNGNLDAGFKPFQGWDLVSLAARPDGSVLVMESGIFQEVSSNGKVRAITPTGLVDPAFKTVVPGVYTWRPPLVLPDGKFWIGTQRYLRNGTKDVALAITLSNSGNVPPCLLKDGRVVFTVRGIGLRAVLPSGAWDEDFLVPIPSGSSIETLAADSNGGFFLRFVATGGSLYNPPFLQRYDSRGCLDPTFHGPRLRTRSVMEGAAPQVMMLSGGIVPDSVFPSTGGSTTPYAVLARPGGLWLAGVFTHVGSERRDGLAVLDNSKINRLAAWTAAVFSQTPPPSGMEAGSADPDGDGLSNVLEYATGGTPLTPSAADGQLLLVSRQPLCYTLPRNPDASDMQAVIEISPNLTNWYPATSTDVRQIEAPYAVKFEVLPTASGAFFRVRFAIAP